MKVSRYVVFAALLPVFLFASWEILDLPTDRGFTEIWAINEQTIFVIGHQGLWKTFDGINWVLDSTPAYPTQIYFVDDTLGFIRGWILTTDGGRTWQKGDTVVGGGGPLSFPEGQSLIGYGAGYDDVRKTEDGGWHWGILPPLPEVYPTSEEYVYPRDICFPSDPDTGYLSAECVEFISDTEAVSRFSCFKTTDGGQTWVLNEEGLWNEDFSPGKIAFPENPRVGYMTGPGKLYRTTDGGAAWDTVLKDLPHICSICFPETDQVGYVFGDSLAHRTLDGGQTWQKAVFTHDSIFGHSYFLNNTVGFITGSVVNSELSLENPYYPGFVLKTTDGLLGIAEEDWVKVEPELIEISTPAVFSQELMLTYQVKEPGCMNVSVFDASGRLTQSFSQHDVGCGDGALAFNVGHLPSGVYFVRTRFTSAQGNQTQILRTVKVR